MYKWGAGGSIVGLLAAAGLAGGVGAVLAWPTLRVRGLYLALLTMAFATLCDNAIFPWSAIFGFNGSVIVPKPIDLRAAHDVAQVLHHLPGRGVRPLLHGRPGPAPRAPSAGCWWA